MFYARTEGPSVAEERDHQPFDIHCPLMGDGLNYWKDSCELRQKNPELKLTCYPKCKASEVKTRTENTVKHNPHNGTTNKVIALAKAGMATGDIAKEFDIEPGTVSRYKWLAKKRGLLT